MGLEAAALIIGGALYAAGEGVKMKEAKQTAEFNARMAREDAATVREYAKLEEEQFREGGEAFKGTQKMKIGGSAAKMEGTPLAMMQTIASRIEADAMDIRKTGERTAKRYEDEAGNYERIASQIIPASLLGMGSTLFSKLGGLKFGSPTKRTPNKSWGVEYPKFGYGW